VAADARQRYAFRNESGAFYELALMFDGVPVFRKTHNLNEARVIGAVEAQARYGVRGAGVRIGLWDAGRIFAHPEFEGRFEIGDDEGANAYSSHATHVAGTLIAAGLDREALGLAPEASVVSYKWASDYLEMYREAQAGLRVSNHSYDYGVGWEKIEAQGAPAWNYYLKPWQFGEYALWSYYWDSVMELNPYYLIVKAAGNEAGQGPDGPTAGHFHNGAPSTYHFDDHDRDCAAGYGCLGPVASIKNGLVVGALTRTGDALAGFSSRGPTLDGRLKPDLVSVGEAVYSTLNGAAYGYSSGTSMAAPTVAGAVALLLDLERRLYGERPQFLGSTLKALLIHTAEDMGNPGPDYAYGWGRINVERAVELVYENRQQGESLIRQLELVDTLSVDLYSPGGEVRVTLAWTDPVGAHPNTIRDKTLPVLNQDVDLVVEQQGRLYYPYVLDPLNPERPATAGKNRVDNVEQVFIPGLPAGPFTLRIVRPAGAEVALPISLVIAGATPFQATSTEPAAPPPSAEPVVFYPNPVARGSALHLVVPLELPQQIRVRVYDAVGRKVATIYEGYTGHLDLSYPVPEAWASGSYYLRVEGEGHHRGRPFVVL
jgi:hypothetical protein